MSCRRLLADGSVPDALLAREAGETIRRGGIVAYPTETLYALAVDPWNHAALRRLIRLKGRPAGMGITLIVGDLAAIDRLVVSWPPSAAGLARRFWPGPLTLIFPANPELPAPVSDLGVAVRWTSHPLAAALARAAGGAVTATSANRSGDPVPPIDPRRVERELDSGIDLLVDAGPLPERAASTIIDTRTDPPRIVRPGAIHPDLPAVSEVPESA